VGGAVGGIGGLGGFALPLAFGAMNDLADVWTSCFMLLFGVAAVSLLWMNFAIARQERAAALQPERLRFLPELEAAVIDTKSTGEVNATGSPPAAG